MIVYDLALLCVCLFCCVCGCAVVVSAVVNEQQTFSFRRATLEPK